MTTRRIVSALGLLTVFAIALTNTSCETSKRSIAGPDSVADVDHDGTPDVRDNCPTVPGEAAFDGCPWYVVDNCSGAAPYKHTGRRWSTMTPTISLGSSLPKTWQRYVLLAARTWNSAGSRLSIKSWAGTFNLGVANDGANVVCYGPILGDALGTTYSWYNKTTGVITNADIMLNSHAPLNIGGDATYSDVYSVLVHEFGHFCGLGHVNDRTHTMFERMSPPGSTIYRTLCDGDLLGLRRLYP